MRAAVDVMGGDRAPAAILKGCWEAVSLLDPGDVIHLVGDEKVIRDGLAHSELTPEQKKHFNVVPTTQVIEMDDSPVEAIRAKPNSSIAVMCKMAAKGEADVVISAGNTGACVAEAQLRMRTLPGVSRPGIAVIIPTFHGPVGLTERETVLLDALLDAGEATSEVLAARTGLAGDELSRALARLRELDYASADEAQRLYRPRARSPVS